jgi:hypothetical protein
MTGFLYYCYNYYLRFGNYLLSTVLPQIYSQNRQAVLNSVDKLVNVISVCDVSERASLIQVFGMISKHEPKVIVIAACSGNKSGAIQYSKDNFL